jgi:hypothetical protein
MEIRFAERGIIPVVKSIATILNLIKIIFHAPSTSPDTAIPFPYRCSSLIDM